MSRGGHPVDDALGYAFRNPALRETALAHASYAHEEGEGRGNERLEYLGDAVLDLAFAHLLFEAHPDWTEGDLTRSRAAAVNQRELAERARALDLGAYVKLGRTEQTSGGFDKDSVLANCLEALLGAVYLDGGLEPAIAVVQRVFEARVAEAPRRDAKTEFQEWAHARFQRTPTYRTVADSGTDDDDQRFTVEVVLAGETWGRGIGRSKRRAERAAALAALERRGAGD